MPIDSNFSDFIIIFFTSRILSVSLRLDSFIKAFLELLFDFKQWQASTF